MDSQSRILRKSDERRVQDAEERAQAAVKKSAFSENKPEHIHQCRRGKQEVGYCQDIGDDAEQRLGFAGVILAEDGGLHQRKRYIVFIMSVSVPFAARHPHIRGAYIEYASPCGYSAMY